MSGNEYMGVKVEPAIKEWIAERALRRRVTMSAILREAISEYLVSHSDTDDELAAAVTMKRKREEDIRLLVPKNVYDSFLFPTRVREFVQKVKAKWKEGEFVTSEGYDSLVGFVELEIKAIKGNPHEELLVGMLREIISRLREEQSMMEGL